MKALLVISSFLVASSALAGGNSVLGRVSAFTGERGTYSFRFEQTAKGYELLKGCPVFDVEVHFKRVPWHSWLPFVEPSHPTFEQTEVAAKFLQRSELEGRSVNFGYMGGGLIASDKPCRFHSKGLVLWEDGTPTVVAFHNPV
jgi:hypothetical protein